MQRVRLTSNHTPRRTQNILFDLEAHERRGAVRVNLALVGGADREDELALIEKKNRPSTKEGKAAGSRLFHSPSPGVRNCRPVSLELVPSPDDRVGNEDWHSFPLRYLLVPGSRRDVVAT